MKEKTPFKRRLKKNKRRFPDDLFTYFIVITCVIILVCVLLFLK